MARKNRAEEIQRNVRDAFEEPVPTPAVDRPQKAMACPTFTLRADVEGHAGVLMAAVELSAGNAALLTEMRNKAREFREWRRCH